MPDAPRHDDRLPGAQREHALALRLVEHEVHGAGQQVDDLLAGGVHLPGRPVGGVVEHEHQAAARQVGAAIDGLPEVGADGDRASVRPVLEVNVRRGEVDGLDVCLHLSSSYGHARYASMTLIVADVSTMRLTGTPAASRSARNSDSVRSLPPVTTSMLRSVPAIMASYGDVPGRSGTMGSTSSSRDRSPIAARMVRRMAMLCSSSQSWMTLFTM